MTRSAAAATLLAWALLAHAASAQSPLLVAPHAPPAAPLGSDWAKTRCGGVTFPAAGVANWQWTPAVAGPGQDYGDDGTVVSGRAVAPAMSDSDNPLVHPFGFDFEWYVAPDPQDAYLLAPGNANRMLGIEIDGGLMPAAYRVHENDRVAIAGRWIVDCGHSDFHTEIHPPLIVAAARALPQGAVIMTVTSRPWLIGQNYPEGDFVAHLRRELMRLLDIPFTQYCCSSQVEVRPPLLPPFDAPAAYDYLLAIPMHEPQAVIRYHFAVRPGVRVELYRPKPDLLAAHIALDPVTFVSASPPPRHDVTYTPADLEKHDEDGRVKAGFEEAQRRLGIAFWARHSLDKGIASDRYGHVVAPFAPCDPGGAELALSSLRVSQRISVPPEWTRDDQPFPVIGWIEISATHDTPCVLVP